MVTRFSLESLRHVRAAHRQGSFSAAAREHGVTQPTLSNSVARLEKQLGFALFHRTTRGTAVTEHGAQLLPLVERALSSFDEIAVTAARLSAPGGGGIRVGISPLLDPTLLAEIHTAAQDHPAGPEIIPREADVTQLRAAFIAGELDLILIPSVAPMAGVERRIIDSEPMRVLGTAGEPMEAEELAGQRLILAAAHCGITAFTRDLIAEHDLAVNIYPGVPTTFRTLEDWAALGLGLAVLPASKCSIPDLPASPLTEDGHEVEIFYEAVWSPDSPLAADLAQIVARISRV